MDIAAQEQAQREQKIGRRQLLIQQREVLRISADAALCTLKDGLGVRDIDLSYVEKIDYRRIKLLAAEGEKKLKELLKLKKEIEALDAALGESES